jgi:hypothetical protein
MISLRSIRPLLYLVLVGSVLTLRAAAHYGFPSCWRHAGSSTALFMRTTPLTSSLARSAHRISRLLSVGWMLSHSGCEFIFPTDVDNRLIVVPKGMGVLKPPASPSTCCLTNQSCPKDPLRIHHLVRVTVLPSLRESRAPAGGAAAAASERGALAGP